MKRKKRRIVYGMVVLLLAIMSLLYHTGKGKQENGLSQAEITWNTKEELEILARVENRIEAAAQGQEPLIPVSSNASGYEGICPWMQAEQRSETEKEAYHNKNEKIAFLTFDDGPTRLQGRTDKILKTIEKYNVKATFFVLGSRITDDNPKEQMLLKKYLHH